MRTRSNPSASSASRTLRTSRSLTPRGSKSPISLQSERSTSWPEVSSRTPQSRGPSARATSSAVRTESLSKSTSTTMFMLSRRPLGELRRREHGVAAVRGDQRVRHRADAAAAPPGRLRVGGDADLGADHRAGDVGRVAVAGLHAVVVVARGHEDDRLAVGRLDDPRRVRRDQRAPGEHAEVDRLEVREERVVALDRHHRLPRLDPVAVVERVDGERLPVVGAELEDRDRLVHAAEHRLVALEDLHHDARAAAVAEERLARVVEVRVGVVALPHLLDREVEDLRRQPVRPSSFAVSPSSSSRQAASAASATSSCSGEGSAVAIRCCSSCPGRASAFASGWSGCRVIQPKTSTAAPTAPSGARDPGRPAEARGRPGGEDVARRRGGEQRADQVRAAAFVLLRALLAVLVRPDRDVLGAVVGGELAAAEREHGRSERERAGEELARRRRRAGPSGGRPGR